MKTIILTVVLLLGMVILNAQEENVEKNIDPDNKIELKYGESGYVEGIQYVVTRHDEVEYIGEILNDDGHELLIKTKTIGLLYIPKFEIKSIIEINEDRSVVYNAYQPEGPFTTRYSFTTNAHPIKKGENYGMINLYGPEAHLALTDKLNIGLMTSWIASPMVLVTKYSFKKKESKVNFSFGTMLGTTGYLNSFKGYGGIHWLNITLGDRKNNLTLTGGYAYLQTGIKDDEPPAGKYTDDEYRVARPLSQGLFKMSHGPILSVAGICKIGAKYSLIFDSMIGYFNYEKVSVDNEYDQNLGTIYTVNKKEDAYSTALFIMPGVRYQNSDRKAFQISVAGVSMFGDSDVSFPFPMCSWFYKF